MKIPYALVAAVKLEQRLAHMTAAIARGLPRLCPVPIDDTRTLQIACYGPSLADTWETLRDHQQRLHQPILSMSGATRFLADRGVIADYHMDMDPRAHKLRHLDPPINGVHYLMASVCPPATWDVLADHPVTLWHARLDASTLDWVRQHDPAGGVVIWTGSTVGLGAIHLGGYLGYRHFEIHGMDSSFAATDPTARHAGPHFGPSQEKHRCTWDAGRVTYQTTRIMANACAEALNALAGFPICCVFHGQGLLQALVRESGLDNACTADDPAADRVRRSQLIFLPAPSPLTGAPPPSYWDLLIDALPKDALPELTRFARQAEQLRPRATYNTGTIPLETALQLRALCHCYRPAIVCEIGTFIGTSTYALHASRMLYTCDSSNDCLIPTDNIVPHPFVSSTLLFKTLLLRGFASQVDLFFFDGRLPADDLPLILALSHPRTIYAFDDCSDRPGANKGHANLALLRAALPDHVYLPPTPTFAGRSTLGALLPTTGIQAATIAA